MLPAPSVLLLACSLQFLFHYGRPTPSFRIAEEGLRGLDGAHDVGGIASSGRSIMADEHTSRLVGHEVRHGAITHMAHPQELRFLNRVPTRTLSRPKAPGLFRTSGGYVARVYRYILKTLKNIVTKQPRFSTAFSEQALFERKYARLVPLVSENEKVLSPDKVQQVVKELLPKGTKPESMLTGEAKLNVAKLSADKRVAETEKMLTQTLEEMHGLLLKPMVTPPPEVGHLVIASRSAMREGINIRPSDANKVFQGMADAKADLLAKERTTLKDRLHQDQHYLIEFLDLFGPAQIALPDISDPKILAALMKQWKMTESQVRLVVGKAPGIRTSLTKLGEGAADTRDAFLSSKRIKSLPAHDLETQGLAELEAHHLDFLAQFDGRSSNPGFFIGGAIKNIRNSPAMKSLAADLRFPADDTGRLMQLIEPLGVGKTFDNVSPREFILFKNGFRDTKAQVEQLMAIGQRAQILLRDQYKANLPYRLAQDELKTKYSSPLLQKMEAKFRPPSLTAPRSSNLLGTSPHQQELEALMSEQARRAHVTAEVGEHSGA